MSQSMLPSGHCIPCIDGYSIHQPLHLGSQTQVYQGTRNADGQPVVLKWSSSDHPSIQDLLRLHNHYTLTHNLYLSGVVRPLSLESCSHGFVLVMPDEGYIPLQEYIAKHSLNLEDGLAIALQLATILHDLSQHRIIHKDIKPANLLIHPQSKHIQLIDFCLASCLPKETQEVRHPNVLEGTLAYLAPEQTGRMNRGIDFRSDFYALGVTLFELLTGQLPFQSADPLDLVHCHLAKPAPSVCDVKPTLPAPMGQIVAKLMAKNAEDRYQSALGLKYDLEIALHQLQTTGSIEAFEIGSKDRSDRFLISEKLYGRDAEVQILLNAFERVARGSSELVLIAGFSGIGKTAVVNEVHKPIVRQRGYFIKGKYDQFNRNIPLSAFVQALRDLMRQLQAGTDDELAQWQAKILTAVGENGQVLIEVIPELEKIIGKQPPVLELSGSADQNRFNLLFQKFIAVLAMREHPLVLFLDDLQWADLASLQLLKQLMNGNRYLLILGTYRDNEISPAHPFSLTVEELKKAQAVIHTITLEPLRALDINHLVTTTLNCSMAAAQPLTTLVMHKTKGNPFFTIQFLKALYDEGYLYFNRDRCYWECDITQINTLALTDDIVEFMALQLQKLPAVTQQGLKLAACVGNQFDLEILAIISQQSSIDAATAIWPALQEGLILPTNQVYKFFQDTDQTDAHNHVNPTYRFLHDRIQQSAYSLIPENHKQSTHLQIGQLLLQNTSEQEREENLFKIVNQLNIGIPLIRNQKEREDLAYLNLAAAQKAKTSAAYAAAVSYLNIAIDLIYDETTHINANAWQIHYSLMLRLHNLLAEVSYLNLEFDVTEQQIETIIANTTDILDRIKAYEIRIQLLVTQNQCQAALDVGVDILSLLNCSLHNAPLPNIDIERLYSLPTLNDQKTITALSILSKLWAPALITKSELLPQIIWTMLNLSVVHGNSAMGAFAYVLYGMLLCATMEDIELGYQFGELALCVLARHEDGDLICKVNQLFHAFIRNWKELAHERIECLANNVLKGLETGDIPFACYSAINYCDNLCLIGKPLADIHQKQAYYIELTANLRQDLQHCVASIWGQFVENLMGAVVDPKQLVGKRFDESQEIPKLYTINAFIALFFFYITKTILSYLFYDYESVLAHSKTASQYEQAGGGLFPITQISLYRALVLLALYPTRTPEQQVSIWTEIKTHQQRLEVWATHAPQNFRHKVDLIVAEAARVQNQVELAIKHYDLAIAGAKVNGYIQEAALSNELAAEFYLDWGKEKIAQIYMTEAYDCYTRWGAKAKADHLTEHYPHLLKSIRQKQPQSFNSREVNISEISRTALSTTNNSPSEALDLTTILKASQSLSREIALEELLSTLLQVLIENAGADKCVLLMPKDNHWVIEALFQLGKPEVILQSIPIEDHQTVPVSLINTIKRTQTPTVIDNALIDSLLASDPYILVQGPKSILCTPILNQGQLIGILYLENNLTIGAFTRDRLLILELLCAQAAISLNNARLYASVKDSELRLEQEVKERTQALEIANQELSRLATVDALTQIANRRSFDQHLTREWQRHLREQQTLSLILIDIDYFKRYNDHYGHPAGDDCLFRVAQALVPILKRPPDLLARYGGEEFGAILPNTPVVGALKVAELMQQAIADLALPHAGSQVKPFVTISMGVASLIPAQHNRAEILISQADQALYKAKRQGRNRAIAWVEPPMIS